MERDTDDMTEIAQISFEGFDIPKSTMNQPGTPPKLDVLMRTSFYLMRFDDDELAHEFQKNPEAFMELGDGMMPLIQWHKDGIEVADACLSRLLIAAAKTITSDESS